MNYAAGDEDVVFRIGGDEFCILTNNPDREYAQQIADKICEMNSTTFDYEDQKMPLSLYATVVNLQECPRYDEVFYGLHHAIRECKTN